LGLDAFAVVSGSDSDFSGDLRFKDTFCKIAVSVGPERVRIQLTFGSVFGTGAFDIMISKQQGNVQKDSPTFFVIAEVLGFGSASDSLVVSVRFCSDVNIATKDTVGFTYFNFFLCFAGSFCNLFLCFGFCLAEI